MMFNLPRARINAPDAFDLEPYEPFGVHFQIDGQQMVNAMRVVVGILHEEGKKIAFLAEYGGGREVELGEFLE